MQVLYTGNTTGNRFLYFRNLSITQKNRHYMTSSLTAISKSLNVKSLNIVMHIVWPIIICWLQKKVPVWILLGRGYKLFIIPHHACVSFPYLFSSLCRLQIWKRHTHAMKQYLQISFYFFISCPLTWEDIWKSHGVLYIYTHRESALYLFEWL